MEVEEQPEQRKYTSRVYVWREAESGRNFGVHVPQHTDDLPMSALRSLTHCTLHVMEMEEPFAMLHYLPGRKVVELTIADTGDEAGVIALRQTAEAGLQPFINGVRRCFESALVEEDGVQKLGSYCMELRYNDGSHITTGDFVLITEADAKHTEWAMLAEFFDLCDRASKHE